MADPVAGIAGSAAKSVRPFRSSEAYVEAMKEDLAEWLNALYGLGLPGGGDGFLTGLATGTTLCQHANAVTEAARALAAPRPARGVAFQMHSVAPGSFMARDNVATFIGWCRTELGVPEVLMFETEDLVLRKNEKSVVLCLLEVARRGARLGLLAPRLVQFEQEIERELRAAPSAPNAPAAEEDTEETATACGVPSRGPRMTPSDLRNLDELVSPLVPAMLLPYQGPDSRASAHHWSLNLCRTICPMERVQVLSTKCTPSSKETSRPTEEEVLGEVIRLSWPGIKSGLHCITAPLSL